MYHLRKFPRLVSTQKRSVADDSMILVQVGPEHWEVFESEKEMNLHVIIMLSDECVRWRPKHGDLLLLRPEAKGSNQPTKVSRMSTWVFECSWFQVGVVVKESVSEASQSRL
jgi:hypothetical protein